MKAPAAVAAALPDASPARLGNAAVTGSAGAAVAEAAVPASPVAASKDIDLPPPGTPPAATSPVIADPKGAPAATGAVQAQLAAGAGALSGKPAARRVDAPAAADATQPTLASTPNSPANSADPAAEIETEAPVPVTGGTLAPGGQASASTSVSPAATPAAAAAGATTGTVPSLTDATPAARLGGMDADLSPLDTSVELPVGEAPRLPETPLPTASSIVLQPMVNDGRFNAMAQISAQILRRLEGQTTRFEMALTPEDLGRVDVTLEIDSDGAVTARLAFDNPAAAAELRAQADQLRRELEAAGLNVSRDGLQFAERDARRDDGGTDRRGAKAFAGAARLEADADAGVAAYRISLADGRLDVRI